MENKLVGLLKEKIKNKKVLILGFGREGKGSLALLKKAGGYESLTISDRREVTEEEVREVFGEGGLPDIITGNSYLEILGNYDLVFKSPGVIFTKKMFKLSTITSQAECFLEAYRDRIIGITGTKGKSTTTTLIYHVLKQSGFEVILLGNIGIPAFDRLEEIGENTKIVFELSSHQLEEAKFSPKWAVYLNVFPEHLDHYDCFEDYRGAKEEIYRNQREGDKLYCGSGVIPKAEDFRGELHVVYDFNRGDAEVLGEKKAETYVKDRWIFHKEKKIEVPEDKIAIKGYHNLFDVGVAFALCTDLGVEEETFLKAVESYKALPHRLEYVGEFDGIKYYDDSISTIPATTIAALETIRDADTILIGGMDRGVDYAPLIDYLGISKVPHIILMEYTGARIKEEIEMRNEELYHSGRLHLVEHLEEAVKVAKEVTRKGKSCIMSPAAASYGIFKNFEERGECFKKLVKG